jgi:UDP-glucose 4-epimerase
MKVYMNFLVTGGCGYIGSNLCNYLISLGHEVTSFDFNVDQPFYLDEKVKVVKKNVLCIKRQDLCDFDHIFHLAGLPRIGISFNDPNKYFLNNAYATCVLLDACVGGKASVTFVSSSSCYSSADLNPYSCSKLMAENSCKMYQKSFGIKIVIARLFNVYGVNHLKSGKSACMIGICERTIQDNSIFQIYGDGSQRRDFTHVDDICNGLYKLVGMNIIHIIDLGFGENYSVKQIVEMFGIKNIVHISSRKGEGNDTLANIELTKKHIEWNPKNNVKDYINCFLNSINLSVKQ